MIPLILLHIPALMTYLLTHGPHDTYAIRRNARDVVEAYRKQDRSAIVSAVEKCKGALTAKNVTEKSLLALHDALCKKYTSLPRPVDDPHDTCDQEAWNHEASYIRDLFGFQVSHPTQGIMHPLSLDLDSKIQSIQQAIDTCLVHLQIRRLPLILTCITQGRQDYMYCVTIQNTEYSLIALGNADDVFYRTESGTWYRESNSSNANAKQCTRLDTVLHVPRVSVLLYGRS